MKHINRLLLAGTLAGSLTASAFAASITLSINNRSGVPFTGTFINCGKGNKPGLSATCNVEGPRTIHISGYGLLKNAAVFSCGEDIAVSNKTVSGHFIIDVYAIDASQPSVARCTVDGSLVSR